MRPSLCHNHPRRRPRLHAQTLCQKHLRLADHGRPKCTGPACFGPCPLSTPPPAITSLAAACNALLRAARPTPPSTTPCSPPCPTTAELQRRVQPGAQERLAKALRRRRPPLAIDLTLVPYHGLPLHE